jgi:hypothetical protein
MRSRRWFGGADLAGFIHRSSIHAEGISRAALRRAETVEAVGDLAGRHVDFLRAVPGEDAESEPYGPLSGWVGGW